MGRLARSHVEDELRARFPGGHVSVETMDNGGAWIEVGMKGGGTLVIIASDRPSAVLAALLAVPDREEQQ